MHLALAKYQIYGSILYGPVGCMHLGPFFIYYFFFKRTIDVSSRYLEAQKVSEYTLRIVTEKGYNSRHKILKLGPSGP